MKKWCQRRSNCEISFGLNKEDFPKIEFKNPNKVYKEVDYKFVRETVKNVWNTLSSRGGTEGKLLVHLIYVLRLENSVFSTGD